MLDEEWPIALSIVHLEGGLYAATQADRRTVTIYAGAEQYARHSFEMQSYRELYDDLYERGFLPLGEVLYYHQRQVDGIDPPTSRHIFNLQGSGFWPSESAAQTWGHIGHTAHSQGDIPLMDLCHRISFEIRACVAKWFGVSYAFRRTLSGLVKAGNFRDGQRFDNGNCFFIHVEIHSLFAELAALRDYLAEFTAQYVLGSYFNNQSVYISKMASLAKGLRNEANIQHPLAQMISELVDDESGWLAEMSAYRDLIVHYAPASMAKGRAFTMQKYIKLPEGIELPTVVFYLPAKPRDIKRARSRGGQFITFEEWAAASTQRRAEQDLEALRYCHRLVGQMANLAIAVAEFSPVRPTMMTFGRSI